MYAVTGRSLRRMIRVTCCFAVMIATFTTFERQAAAAYKYCVDLSPSYLDQGLGEDELVVPPGGSIRAKYHYYRMWNASSTQVIMDGWLDSAGCSATTTVGTGKFEIFSLVRHGIHPNTVVIRTKRESTSDPLRLVYFTLTWPSSPGGTVTTKTLHVGTLLSDYFRVSAVAMELEPSLLVAGQDWTILVRADTDTACPGQATGCASSSVIWLGQLPDGTWNNQYKSVIAHELGHLSQGALFGFPSSPGAAGPADYSDTPNDELFCGCWYVENPNDRLHCLTSREYLAPAFAEAYAHYFASRAFNTASENDAVYPYYKRVLMPRAQNPTCGPPGGTCYYWQPPVAHDVLNANRWLETQCPGDAIAHRATEMDWLGLLYDLGTKRDYSGADLRAIMEDPLVCNGWCNGSDEMEWDKIDNSVNVQAGFSPIKQAYFDARSIAFGVKR